MKARLLPHLLCLVTTAVAALAFRLHQLETESIWLDEAHTFFRASKPIAELLNDCIQKRHNPTYFFFMHFWLTLGDDELMMRLPSVVFGVLTVTAVYAVGVIVGGWRAGLVAAGLMAISPYQVRYGQEARMYTIVTFAFAVTAAGTLWLAKHPEQAGRPLLGKLYSRVFRRIPETEEPAAATAQAAWLCVVLGSILALYMHNTSLFILFALLSAGTIQLLANPGRRLPLFYNWLISACAILAAWAVWLPFFFTQVKNLGARQWGVFSPDRVGRTFLDLYLLGKYNAPLSVLIAACAIAGVWALRRDKRVLGALLALWISGPAAVILVSLHRSVFLPRIMLWTAIPFFVLVAAGLHRIKPAFLFVAITAGLLTWGAATDLRKYYKIRNKTDWKEIARFLPEEYARPNTVIIVSPRTGTPLNYYSRRKTDRFDGVRYTSFLGAKKRQRYLSRLVKRADTVWYIDAPSQSRRRREGCSRSTLRWLDERGRRVYAKGYGAGVFTYRYDMTSEPTGEILDCGAVDDTADDSEQ